MNLPETQLELTLRKLQRQIVALQTLCVPVEPLKETLEELKQINNLIVDALAEKQDSNIR